MSSLAILHPLLPSASLPFDSLSDTEAVNEVVGGRREVFALIVRRYNPQLYRVGMAYLRDHAQTEDAMQNAYLKAFLNLSRFRGTAAFATWLTRIMINECLMILRRQRRVAAQTLTHRQENIEAFAEPATDPLHAQEMKALLEKALQALPRTHRAVYLLREVQQLSTAETAACLKLSRANVRISLHRARQGLKIELLKNAPTMELFDYPATYCNPMVERVMLAIQQLPPSAA
ncbi:MAG: sigma-70 family RNA polymerase sigma factor [Opitutaceae bacterium]